MGAAASRPVGRRSVGLGRWLLPLPAHSRRPLRSARQIYRLAENHVSLDRFRRLLHLLIESRVAHDAGRVPKLPARDSGSRRSAGVGVSSAQGPAQQLVPVRPVLAGRGAAAGSAHGRPRGAQQQQHQTQPQTQLTCTSRRGAPSPARCSPPSRLSAGRCRRRACRAPTRAPPDG